MARGTKAKLPKVAKSKKKSESSQSEHEAKVEKRAPSIPLNQPPSRFKDLLESKA
jgi:hypothetical protein